VVAPVTTGEKNVVPVETGPPHTHHFEQGAPYPSPRRDSEPPPPPNIQPEFVEERTPPPRQPNETPPPFLWPPPRASAFQVLPRKLLVGEKETVRLKDVNTTLNSAFEHCGYSDRSYYTVPDGFAIASRIEQINEDGTPSSNRWSLDVPPMEEVSIKAYLRALFKAPRGHYRVIVFIVTPHPFSQGDTELSASGAAELVSKGANTLPEAIGNREYSSNYKCTALIRVRGTGQTVVCSAARSHHKMHLQNADCSRPYLNQQIEFAQHCRPCRGDSRGAALLCLMRRLT
jgi:hypothetical protein